MATVYFETLFIHAVMVWQQSFFFETLFICCYFPLRQEKYKNFPIMTTEIYHLLYCYYVYHLLSPSQYGICILLHSASFIYKHNSGKFRNYCKVILMLLFYMPELKLFVHFFPCFKNQIMSCSVGRIVSSSIAIFVV